MLLTTTTKFLLSFSQINHGHCKGGRESKLGAALKKLGSPQHYGGTFRSWLRPLVSDLKRFDRRCHLEVFCEVPSTDRQAAWPTDQFVFRKDKVHRPVKDGIRTPQMFLDHTSTAEIQAAEKLFREKTFTEFVASTPQPSDWLFPAAIRQTNANHPIEDRGIVETLDYSGRFLDEPHNNSKWMLAAVIDGHSGWQTSEYVSKVLAPTVQRHLRKIEGGLSVDRISDSLIAAFLDIDSTLRSKIDPAVALGHSLVAKPGATTVCCLLNGGYIVVANVGDSRAILCRKGKPIALSACHNAGDPVEAEKLRAAHPGEGDIIKEKQGSNNISSVSPNTEDHGNQQRLIYDQPENLLLRFLTALRIHDFSKPRLPGPACYTKGRLQLTRAFGDFYLKDHKYANDWTNSKLMVGTPHSFPYVSAVPEITVIKQVPEEDDFMILASDGVWDELTAEDACEIVSRNLTGVSGCANAATAVQTAVIERVAYKHRMTVEQVEALAPKQRRSIMDDVTCIVIDLKNRETN